MVGQGLELGLREVNLHGLQHGDPRHCVCRIPRDEPIPLRPFQGKAERREVVRGRRFPQRLGREEVSLVALEPALVDGPDLDARSILLEVLQGLRQVRFRAHDRGQVAAVVDHGTLSFEGIQEAPLTRYYLVLALGPKHLRHAPGILALFGVAALGDAEGFPAAEASVVNFEIEVALFHPHRHAHGTPDSESLFSTTGLR
jgi:hypothetical protein